MPDLSEFLSDVNHCRMSEYTLEFRLCRKANCNMCEKMGRKVRTPVTFVNGYNLRDEMLRWQDLATVNDADSEHFCHQERQKTKLIMKIFYLINLRG